MPDKLLENYKVQIKFCKKLIFYLTTPILVANFLVLDYQTPSKDQIKNVTLQPTSLSAHLFTQLDVDLISEPSVGVACLRYVLSHTVDGHTNLNN